jgi:hypothetical protein
LCKVGEWVRSHMSVLADAEPPMPVEDRAADCWESLVAIADQAGGDWPTRARRAAAVLTAEAEHADTSASMGVRLLADLRDLFTMRAQTGAPLPSDDGHLQFYAALFTDTILSGLYAMTEAPAGRSGVAGRSGCSGCLGNTRSALTWDVAYVADVAARVRRAADSQEDPSGRGLPGAARSAG